jgi:MYXO-CTERM domain-containing protein
MSTVRSFSHFAAGAAIMSCSIASASPTPNLMFSTVNSASGSMTLGSTTGSFSYTGPTTYMVASFTMPPSSGTGSCSAFHASGYDAFIGEMGTVALSGSGSASLTLVINAASPVEFRGNGIFTAMLASNWTANGNAVVVGDVLAAGTYTFVGNGTYSGVPDDLITMGFTLVGASSPGVPLPGAAGLAAVGLAGLTRRRRR